MKQTETIIEDFITEIKKAYQKLEIEVRDFGDGFIKISHNSFVLEKLSTNFNDFIDELYYTHFHDVTDAMIGFDYSDDLANGKDPYALDVMVEMEVVHEPIGYSVTKPQHVCDPKNNTSPVNFEPDNSLKSFISERYNTTNSPVKIPAYDSSSTVSTTQNSSKFCICVNSGLLEVA